MDLRFLFLLAEPEKLNFFDPFDIFPSRAPNSIQNYDKLQLYYHLSICLNILQLDDEYTRYVWSSVWFNKVMNERLYSEIT